MWNQLIFSLLVLYHADAASLWCYESKDVHTETPLSSPLGLLKSPFDLNKTTVIYTFGFDGTPEGKDASVIIDAYTDYKAHHDINFLLLQWEFEANAKALGLLQYPLTGIENAHKVGHQLGDALIELSKHGLNLDRVHLVGHSLGAHLMAHAGKRTQERGKYIQRITGLDPAGPLYTGPITLVEGLQNTDAKFVDVLHTDPYNLGKPEKIGHIDIWTNCDMKIQPGCPDIFKGKCSHLRGTKYFAEAIKNPLAFPAVQAESCDDWKLNSHRNIISKIVYLGEDIDTQARGNFYLRTNKPTPSGRGLIGLRP